MQKRFFQCTLASLALFAVVALQGHAEISLNKAAVKARMVHDVTFLASDECEGRGPGTKGLDKAADFIAGEFSKAGLKPAGNEGTFYQPFEVNGPSSLQGKTSLTLMGPQGQQIELQLGKDFQVMGFSAGKTVTAPLVFVGFGITAKDVKYDDYKDINVDGKIVIMLRHTPRWDNKYLPFDGKNQQRHAGLEGKQGLAEANKAAAVILVNDLSEKGDKLMPFSYVARATPSSIPAVHVKRRALDGIFRSALGTDLAALENSINSDLHSESAPLAGWSAKLQTGVVRKTIPVKNVIGVLEGAGPLAKETIVIGAHYDHLGYGGNGSRSGNKGKKEIHHGADDNASGSTALIELARRFGDDKNRQGRRLVFIAFSAEEMGLLGSRHYCEKQPLFSLKDTAAMVNLDMVGRMSPDPKSKKGKLTIQGVGTGKNFAGLVDQLFKHEDLELGTSKGGLGPSDHASFFRKEIPVLFFFTGTHVDYHKPSDTSDKINVEGMIQVTSMAERLVAQLATDKDRPVFVNERGSSSPGRISGPKLGIIPDYAEGQKGLAVGGVIDMGAAAKAGLKTGDVIVEMAGKSVQNINSYMAIMSQQRPGREMSIVILRGKERIKLKITPQ